MKLEGKMKGILSLITSIILFQFSFAKEQYKISGYVFNNCNGEGLLNVNVAILGASLGTTTNERGFYELEISKGDYRIGYSYVGYETEYIDIILHSDEEISVILNEKKALDEITVTATDETLLASSKAGRINVPVEKIDYLPSFLGESDVIKTIQLLPGIQSGNEGTSGLYIRGGGPDQNLILLNGTPLYNIDHLFGFFSIFNQDAIDKITLYKGGFPARFGGRLSSVVDIQTRDGDSLALHGKISIGLVASKINLEGPLKKGKTTFSVSARRTYADLIAGEFLKNKNSDDVFGNYYFYDLNTNLTHKFSNRSKLFATFYKGYDEAFLNIADNYTFYNNIWEEKTYFNLAWGNMLGSLRWEYKMSDRIKLSTFTSYSNYKFDVISDHNRINHANEDKEKYYLNYRSGINDLILKVDFLWQAHSAHLVKFGANYTRHKYSPQISMKQVIDREYRSQHDYDTINNDQVIRADEVYFYIEDAIDVTPRWSINAGLHLSAFSVQGELYKSLEPRFISHYHLSNRIELKAFYSVMSQYIHLLSSSSIDLPTDLWLPATKKVKPQNSWQGGLGLSWNMNSNFKFDMEAFYKEMDGIIEYRDGASFMGTVTGWEDKVDVGKGWSYGIENLIHKTKGKTTGWLGYTLSWSERKFEVINYGQKFPARYDRRHDVSFAAMHKFSEKVDMGMVWVFGTGNAVTLPTQEYYTVNSGGYIEENPVVEYIEGRNNYRMANYHRFDLNFNFHKKKKHGVRTWKVGFYNMYNRHNPFFLRYGYDENSKVENIVDGEVYESSKKVLKQVSLFPIIPSFTYSYKF